MENSDTVSSAAVVLPCPDLESTLAFFQDRLGFQLETIFPADDPGVALISGHGLRLRLERGSNAPPSCLWLPRSAVPTSGEPVKDLLAPNGTRITFGDKDVPADLGPAKPEFVLQKLVSDSNNCAWNEGRAGMRYRDLIPGRWNGHFIASHIQIPVGGPVPDYVHYHDVLFQMIYCHQGWVRVVYEDQGAPFVIHPGDCVLQPPGIRHQVLEASDGLEVIEIGCPALHATHAEHTITLPTDEKREDRVFGGQRFVRHRAVEADWKPWRVNGYSARDLGIAASTDGCAAASVVRASDNGASGRIPHPGGFQFLFILTGEFSLTPAGHPGQILDAGDAVTLPPGMDCVLINPLEGMTFLEVTVSPEVFSH